MRVVALVPGGIDQQLLFFPTLDALKANYPDASIDVVVEPRAKEAYRICKAVREVVPFDFQVRNSLADWGNLLGMLRDREYEVAISLSPKATIGFLLWLTGIPTRIGYRGSGAEPFLTNAIALNANQYAAMVNHDLLQGLSVKTATPELSINLPAKDLDWADAERKRLGLQSGTYLLLQSSFNSAEQYPIEGWKGIIKAFQQKQPDFPIVVAQGAGDTEFVAQLLAVVPELKVTQPTDLGKLAAMIAGASLVICTDGAPMQLAVAVKTYTVGLFGKTEPKLRLPQGDRFLGIKSLTSNLADISPQMVMDKVMGGA